MVTVLDSFGFVLLFVFCAVSCVVFCAFSEVEINVNSPYQKSVVVNAQDIEY